MKHSVIFVGACLSSALLAACGGSHGVLSPGSIVPPAATTLGTSGEKILYSFEGGSDGSYPESALVDVSGTLYGATKYGGIPYCRNGSHGCGTIFKIRTSGAGYDVVHRYAHNSKDGADPIPGVIYAGGALYGTTEWGGGVGCGFVNGCGTVFKMDPSGKAYQVLHSFNGTDIGDGIVAGVLDVNGTLYGAVAGNYNGNCRRRCGTLFEVNSSSGKATVLYNFGRHGRSGNDPVFTPIDVAGTLYGTTVLGGDLQCDFRFGCGVVYKMNPSTKQYTVVHRFTGGTDGAFPNNVIAQDGVLYGTTEGGGAACGCGTVFKIGISSGAESVLYRFKGGEDGNAPTSLLADVNGKLYSTTSFGGGTSCTNSGYAGCGTAFGIKTSGKDYHVLYRFQGGADGANPVLSGVIDVNGALYGTTFYGGGTGCGGTGCGTVFRLVP